MYQAFLTIHNYIKIGGYFCFIAEFSSCVHKKIPNGNDAVVVPYPSTPMISLKIQLKTVQMLYKLHKL